MEMLDGTEVARVVGALGAGPVAVDGMWIEANQPTGAEMWVSNFGELNFKQSPIVFLSRKNVIGRI